ncbi:MAG: SMC-Scp complex subunit ScpB [Candidatus Sedimenticola endophacoides]
MSSESKLKKIIEAALFAAGEPLSVDRLLELFPEQERPERKDLRGALEALQSDYAGRGVELAEVGGGYRFNVRADFAPWVLRLWEERPARYSRALLETLALIAYRQPITRGEIEEIRGVSVSTNIMKTLLEREWVRVVGHRDVPGKPSLYATTREFLNYFGLKGLEELPTLQGIRDHDSINRELQLEEHVPPLKAADATQEEALEPVGDERAGEEGAPPRLHVVSEGDEAPPEDQESDQEPNQEPDRESADPAEDPRRHE